MSQGSEWAPPTGRESPSGAAPGGAPLPSAAPVPEWGADYKPGVIPLRPLGLGEILDGAFTTVRQNPVATLGMSAAVVAVAQILNVVLLLIARHSSVALVSVAIANGLVRQVAGLALSAGLVTVVAEAVLGRRLGIDAAWNRVRPRLGTVIGTALLTLVIVAGLTITVIGIPFAIYLFVGYSLSQPAVILEGHGVRAAMRRSRDLVRSAWWRTFGILALAALITGVIAGVLVAVLSLIGLAGGQGFVGFRGNTGLGTSQLLLSAVGGVISGALVAPISAGVVALLYIDRRIRTEGLDIALAEAARRGQPGAGGLG